MVRKPEKAGPKQAKPSTRFPPGVSGNPAGKPKGTRHRATMLAQELLDGQAEGLAQKAIELAMAGDVVALRLCLERLVPPRRDAPINLALPPINSPSDLLAASAAVLAAVAEGSLTPGEAQAVAGLLEAHRRSVELVDIESRLQALEGRQPTRRGTR